MRIFEMILVLVMGGLLFGCEQASESQTHHVSVLIDRTELDAYKPSADILFPMIKPKAVNDAVHLSLTAISDTKYNSKQTYILEKGTTGWMANEVERRSQVRRFYAVFSDSLKASNSKMYRYSRSAIYQTVITELNDLASAQGTKKLFLFSDLKEHSFFSVYHSNHLRLLEYHPDKVKDLFEKQIKPLDAVKGIELHILYRPNLEDEAVFTQMIALYKAILEPKGVVIKIGFHQRIAI